MSRGKLRKYLNLFLDFKLNMKTYKNLTLIGTSHIAQQSINDVTKSIEQMQPKIVALELDKTRFVALMETPDENSLKKKKRKIGLSNISKIGVKGYLFSLIGAYLQKKLGRIVNVQPGSEMLTAINLARKHNTKIALVDQPIEITLKRFSQEFTWREKLKILIDILKGIFSPKKQLKKYGMENFDLTKVPSDKLIRKLIKNLKKRYPSLYKVLIKERNQVIAKNLKEILKQNPEDKVIAVIGAGHEEEILKLVKK